MSERSELLKKVLDTWEHSDEGRGYLEWLLQPEAANLDGGDVLREAVLDVVEDDDQLSRLQRQRVEEALQKFCAEAQLPPATGSFVTESTVNIAAGLSQVRESVRKKAELLRKLRRALKRDRLETLQIVAQMLRAREPDEIESLFKKFAVMQELAAKIAALSRTSAEQADVEAEWRSSANDDEPFEHWLKRAHNAGEGWFNYTSEELDQYYSHQLPSRLEKIVDRASALEPINLEVTNRIVRSLFHEAHEAFLYGFEASCIALCRSLVDHALRDRLSVPQYARPPLRSMIDRAKSKGLLDGQECASAERVEEAGNKVMHNMSNLRSTAQDILYSTRIVLNKLYGNATDAVTNA